MYFLQNKVTGQPVRNPKTYDLRVLAVRDALKTESKNHLKPNRIDVVEISKSARLYLENQARLNQDTF